MQRAWTMKSGYQQFPYDVKKMRRGVKFKIDTRRKNSTVMRIVNTEPSAVFIEFVGRKSYAKISKVLTLYYGPPGRFMYPAVEKALPAVAEQLKRRVIQVTKDVENEFF
jgi:predicted RNA-binding protein